MPLTRPVPERIRHLLDEMFATPTRFCFERARLVIRSYRETEGSTRSSFIMGALKLGITLGRREYIAWARQSYDLAKGQSASTNLLWSRSLRRRRSW